MDYFENVLIDIMHKQMVSKSGMTMDNWSQRLRFFYFFGIKFIMKILRNARGKQTKNTASQGITLKQLQPSKHVLI